jgi:hypothetical protein
MYDCFFVIEALGAEQLKLHCAIDIDEKANIVTLKNKLFKNTDIISPFN